MRNLLHVGITWLAVLISPGLLVSQEQTARPTVRVSIEIGQSLAEVYRLLRLRGIELGEENGAFAVSFVNDDTALRAFVLDENHTIVALGYSKSRKTVTSISLVFHPSLRSTKPQYTWVGAKSVQIERDGSYVVHFLPPVDRSEQRSDR